MPVILEKNKLHALLENLAGTYRLVIPVREEGLTRFTPYRAGLEMDRDYINTGTSPKEFLFPQTEKILAFVYQGCENVTITGADAEPTRQILFGVRSCDLAGIEALDPVFAGRFPDPLYRTRRENSILVGWGCRRAADTCFCQSFKIDPLACAGADVAMLELDDCFTMEARTDQGRLLLEQAASLLVETEPGYISAGLERIREELDSSFNWLPELAGVKDILDSEFELPYWEEIAPRCIGCGICTYICPTCHCFDIFDFTRGKPDGKRFRCWDSCLSPEFTRMAGGHNPRPGKKERVRNRFMHKLKYHLDRYGVHGCTGCGRCVARCPVNMDIRKVISDIKGRKGGEVLGR